MKKLFFVEAFVLLLLILFSTFSYATEITSNIFLGDTITVDDMPISRNVADGIYLSSQMDNGATSASSKEANVNIENIINITKPGTYTFSGTLKDGQISVNANLISGEVNIILDNANITCSNAPAIFVYHKDIRNEDCKVTISTTNASINTITGGRLKESVLNWPDQSSLLYSVEKSYDEDGSYFERYKYDGAISSDISLTFEGEGTLNVVSTKKEGIEIKNDITINSGNLIITSLDDAINACADGESVVTINGGLVVAYILLEADEGDGIDSNGNFYINGGTVYAFANPGADNGLDADKGVEINGGTVFSTGSIYEPFISKSNTTIIQSQFSNRISSNHTVVLVDSNKTPVFAYKSDRTFSTLAYTSPDIQGKDISIYTGADIDGPTDKYGIYTDLSNIVLDKLTLQKQINIADQNNAPKNTFLIIISLIIAFVLFVIIIIYNIKTENDKKIRLFLNLLIGFIIGFLITFGIMRLSINKPLENDFEQPPHHQTSHKQFDSTVSPEESTDTKNSRKDLQVPNKPNT